MPDKKWFEIIIFAVVALVTVNPVLARNDLVSLTSCATVAFASETQVVESELLARNEKNNTVNVRDFGAKGDGVADDYNAIQTAINWCFTNDKMLLSFPQGTYNISSPLVVKSKRENAAVKWWDGKAVKLIGADKATTRIVKTTNNVLTGIHSEVDNLDATIICFNGANLNGGSGGSGTGIDLKNLYIENKSTSDNAMAITGTACQRMELDNLNIQAHSGIIFNRCFSSNFSNIVFYCKEKAMSITGDCTSNAFTHIYAPNCKNPYIIRGAYSGMYMVYADNATGNVFDVGGGGMVMVDCGTESPKAQYIVKCDYLGKNSEVYITSLSIHRQTGDVANGLSIEDCAVFYGDGKIKCDSLRILDNKAITGNSYLCTAKSSDSYASFEIGRVLYYQNYTGAPNHKLKYSNQKSNGDTVGKLGVEGVAVNIRRNSYMPYLGSRDVSKSIDMPFVDKAIYLDNASKTKDSFNNDLQWEEKYNKGDILLINDPASMNILGYVVTNGGETYVKDGVFAEIPIVLRGITTERPTVNRFVGMCYYDTTISKPIWWNGTEWRDALGQKV